MHIDPSDRSISIKKVCAKLGVGKSTIYLWVSLDQFPQSHSLGLRCSRWLESKVSQWMAEKYQGGAKLGGGVEVKAWVINCSYCQHLLRINLKRREE